VGFQFQTEEQVDLTLPEDSIHRAQLDELKMREVQFTNRNTGQPDSFTKLEWWWKITSSTLGDQYIGRKVKGECDAKLTSHPGNKFRVWAETLLGRQIPVGMVIDTDDLVGLQADISIGHRPDRKDASRVWEFVDEVLPISGGFELSDEPPF